MQKIFNSAECVCGMLLTSVFIAARVHFSLLLMMMKFSLDALMWGASLGANEYTAGRGLRNCVRFF